MKEMFRALMSEARDYKSAGSGLQEIENDSFCFQGLTRAWLPKLNGTLVSELPAWTTVDLALAAPSHHQNGLQVGWFSPLVITVHGNCSSNKPKLSLRHLLTMAFGNVNMLWLFEPSTSQRSTICANKTNCLSSIASPVNTAVLQVSLSG